MVGQDETQQLFERGAAGQVGAGAVEDDGVAEEKIDVRLLVYGRTRYDVIMSQKRPKIEQKATSGKPLVISYVRFSSPQQSRGESKRRQLEKSQAWADERGLTIDESFSGRDEGISAYRGKHLSEGALGIIMRNIKSGRIPKGSTLLVESLDRLSRDDIDKALSLLLDITTAGVRVVTLADGAEYSNEAPMHLRMTQLLISLSIFMRANDESRMKTDRLKDTWNKRRERAIETGKVMNAATPAWIETKGGKLLLNAERAAIVTRIFDLMIKGYGLGVITRMFNREGLKPMGRSSRWHTTYIHWILRERHALGELTVSKVVEGERVPVKTIKDYYPAVVDEATYNAANAMLGKRRNKKSGGPNGKTVNIWNGLLYDEQGESYTTYEKRGNRSLVSMGALLGKTDKQINIRQTVFEQIAFILIQHELYEQFRSAEPDTEDVEPLRKKVLAIQAKIDQISDDVLAIGGGALKGVVELLHRLEIQKQEAEAELQEFYARQVAYRPNVAADMMQRTDWLMNDTADQSQREGMQATLRTLIRRLTMSLSREGAIISGKVVVEPNLGERFGFWFTYNPYTNTRGENPLDRADWGMKGGKSLKPVVGPTGAEDA